MDVKPTKKNQDFFMETTQKLLLIVENLWQMMALQDQCVKSLKNGTKDVFHALMECKATRELWKTLIWLQKLRKQLQSIC